MSIAKIYTRASVGIDAPQINVEVHISNGMPSFTLVGLPEVTVKESKDRVRSAIINSGFTFPSKRMTINLSPADLPKEGSRFDLPIAIAILVASGQIIERNIDQYEFLGELSLIGEVKKVRGAIPSCIASKRASRKMVISIENESEIALIEDNNTLISSHLNQICDHLNGNENLATAIVEQLNNKEPMPIWDDIIGQEHAKRALLITAVGGHNLLLIGPPGTGKTMLANRLINLLPNLTMEQAIETAAVSSLAHELNTPMNWLVPPFRAPHHSASTAALVGGGSIPKPGEISLAHNGVLFLDELAEFNRKVLDALREPLEAGKITISRATSKITFPAKVQLIAAMNPSPTGHYQGVHNRTSPQIILKYLSKLSGPFLDRFDLSIEVPLLPKGSLSQQNNKKQDLNGVKKIIIQLRDKQYKERGKLNNELTKEEIDKYCHLSDEDALFLENALTKLGLSVRAWHRLLRVSRTIADLDQSDIIKRHHLIESLNYRAMDKLLINLHKKIG